MTASAVQGMVGAIWVRYAPSWQVPTKFAAFARFLPVFRVQNSADHGTPPPSMELFRARGGGGRGWVTNEGGRVILWMGG
jgi:hypothetical protein